MRHLKIDIQKYEVDGEVILGPISMVLNEHQRCAIVGGNGIGKSTFLRILRGDIREYVGSVENIGSLTLGYLEQIHFLDDTLAVRDDLANAFQEIRVLERQIHVAELQMSKT